MMDFINDISTESVLELIKANYFETTGKQIQMGSDEFALSSVVAYIFGVLVQKFNAQAKQRYLSTATGEYLNALGDTFDLPRPAPIHAVCRVAIHVSHMVVLMPGEFIITDANGVQFTPVETIEFGEAVEILFVGYENENVLDENNIEIGALNVIKTPVDGVTSVSNTTVTGGARDEFPYNDEGDEEYRQYIIAQRSAVSVGGPAAAYEQRAKEADARVLDAYCVRYTDDEYEPGKAKIYVLTDTDTEGEQSTVLERVRAALLDPSWKPVCDVVEVNAAETSSFNLSLSVGLSAKNAISGRTKFENDLRDYLDEIGSHLGEAFSLSELCRRAQTPDENGVKTEWLSTDGGQHLYEPVAKTTALRGITWDGVYYEIV